MTLLIHLYTAMVLATLPTGPAPAEQHPPMPAGMTHEQHQAQMKKDAEIKERGQISMGFDQDQTTHHFTLIRTGGTIAVSVNEPVDLTIRSQIRSHLQEVASAFSHGDFEKPLMTHGEEPLGAATMRRHATDIAYTYTPTAEGGVVQISTADPDALDAVHDFLRYQIREHRTGDPTALQR